MTNIRVVLPGATLRALTHRRPFCTLLFQLIYTQNLVGTRVCTQVYMVQFWTRTFQCPLMISWGSFGLKIELQRLAGNAGVLSECAAHSSEGEEGVN